MANTSVDGLVSGLNTTDVIQQLLSLERQPQAQLQTQRKALDGTKAAYQVLNTRFDALRVAAQNLDNATDWQAMKATTTDSSRLTATAAATATSADLDVSIERLARAHTVVSETTVNSLDAVVASGPITFTVGGTPAVPIDVGDGKLSTVVANINAAGVGVRAAAVQVSPGQYRLQLTASSTGTAAAFTVDATSLAALDDPTEGTPDPEAFNVVVAGTDARLLVGGTGGYEVLSATNTFHDLLPGVDLTATKAESGALVGVHVGADADALVAKAQSLVNAVNAVFTTITGSTSYDASTGQKGVLLGNSLTRDLQQRLYGALGIDLAGKSLADVGMKMGASGLELDKDKLLTAFAADPAATIDAFTGGSTVATTDGLATKLADLGTLASNSTTGMVTLAITSNDAKAKDYDDRIADWDVRLATRETTLRSQFAAMEAALGTLKNQSTWLAGQISSLPSWSS